MLPRSLTTEIGPSTSDTVQYNTTSIIILNNWFVVQNFSVAKYSDFISKLFVFEIFFFPFRNEKLRDEITILCYSIMIVLFVFFSLAWR